ncbi:MAG: OsmC family protein [Balneolaceae bacterium]|nr:OsmC family protein [Balneolaceae bacterium]
MSTAETVISYKNDKLKDSLLELIQGIQSNPEQADATFKAKSKLENGFLSNIKIRNFEFVSDEPVELGGTNEGPNPVEYVLGAFAACQEIVIKAYATVLDIDVKAVHVEVDGNLDLHGFLNLSEERAGFKSVSYKTTIETNETDTEKLKTLEKLSVDRCPVLDIIRNPVKIDGQVDFKAF